MAAPDQPITDILGRIAERSGGTMSVILLMLTARAQPQDLEQAYAAGATEDVAKPFSPRDLQARVADALHRVGR
jgi:CheY-like chemotaxis protein